MNYIKYEFPPAIWAELQKEIQQTTTINEQTLTSWKDCAVVEIGFICLEKGEVDPTKVALFRRIILLAAVDTSPLAKQVLTQAADLARRSDGEVIVLHVIRVEDAQGVNQLQQQAKQILADIRYRFITTSGTVPEEIVRTAQDYNVAEIIIGKRGHRSFQDVLIGSVSQTVLETSLLPVIVVEDHQSKISLKKAN